MKSWICVVGVLLGCGSAPHRPTAATLRAEQRAVARVLDDWHRAAAGADEARYFSHLSGDAVFLGTDATERWSTAAFRAYAHPHFARGRAWAFHATRRDIVVDPGGRLAWFDEDLATGTLGPARGSGVLRRDDTGRWRIVQYNLAVTVPNGRFDAVRAAIDERPRACALSELPNVDLELRIAATPSCRRQPSRTMTVRLDDRPPRQAAIPCSDEIRAPPATTSIRFEGVRAGVHHLDVSAAPDGVSATADIALPALEIAEGGGILAGAFVRVSLSESPAGRGPQPPARIEIAEPTALDQPGL